MARPVKCRKIEFLPHINLFLPQGQEGGEKEGIILRLEELEALRLKDLKGLSQQECAHVMEVSRQTFQNILEGARKKVAEALVMGLPLQIKGGDFAFQSCQFQCSLCKATYKINFIRDKSNCPLCKSDQIVCLNRKAECSRHCKG